VAAIICRGFESIFILLMEVVHGIMRKFAAACAEMFLDLLLRETAIPDGLEVDIGADFAKHLGC
jgi:hypothetical protein